VVSVITREAADELGLAPGVVVDAVIKATSVSVEIPTRSSHSGATGHTDTASARKVTRQRSRVRPRARSSASTNLTTVSVIDEEFVGETGVRNLDHSTFDVVLGGRAVDAVTSTYSGRTLQCTGVRARAS